MITIEKTELKELIREVIREELLKLAISLTPYVSKQEMEDIEKALTDEDLSDADYEDMTAWIGK